MTKPTLKEQGIDGVKECPVCKGEMHNLTGLHVVDISKATTKGRPVVIDVCGACVKKHGFHVIGTAR